MSLFFFLTKLSAKIRLRDIILFNIAIDYERYEYDNESFLTN